MNLSSLFPLIVSLWATGLAFTSVLAVPTSARADQIEIRGKVVDAVTGKPITQFVEQGGHLDKGRIEWGFWEKRSSSPITDGRFSANIDWNGGWRMRILADGYASQPVLIEAPPAGAKSLDIVVEMHRGRKVEGRVLDADGKPVADAAVFLVGKRPANITGGKAVQSSFEDGEDKSVTRVTTAKDGTFTLTGSGDDVERVAVSTPKVDLWVVPAPDDVKAKVEVRLPRPAKLAIRYDIPGASADGEFFIQMTTYETPGWVGVNSEVNHKVANGKSLTLANLPPGSYWITRTKKSTVGNRGFSAMLDRQKITLKPGGEAEAIFVRKTGAPVTGKVEGIDPAKIDGASVRIKPGKPTTDPLDPTFDEAVVGPDGTFKTDRLLPGEYTIRVSAYAKQGPNGGRLGGIEGPALSGTAKVVVPAEGSPKPVTIQLKPAAAGDLGF